MSSHQTNQANSSVGTSYQYQWGDQVLEIPSNINYQLENVMSGGVSNAHIFIERFTFLHINSLRGKCIRFNKYHEQPGIQIDSTCGII